MDELKTYFREGLIARIRALESARSAHAADTAGAEGTIRRIAHSLHGAGGTYGFPEVSQAAALVEHAAADELLELLDALLSVLRELSLTSDLGNTGILVLEDDSLLVHMYEHALEGPGREIIMCASRAEAVQALETRDISMVILDVTLADFDGRDFLTWLRKRPGSSDLPVLVVTAI